VAGKYSACGDAVSPYLFIRDYIRLHQRGIFQITITETRQKRVREMLKKALFCTASILIVAVFCYAGLEIGEVIVGPGALSRMISVVGTIVGLLCLVDVVVYHYDVDGRKTELPVTLADDLNPGLYQCLGFACHSGRSYHMVVPCGSDMLGDWQAEPFLVRRCDDDIPQGMFTVLPARRIIRPREEAGA